MRDASALLSANPAVGAVKWVGILLQGLCTLVAIAMVHSDNRLTCAITLTLFATGAFVPGLVRFLDHGAAWPPKRDEKQILYRRGCSCFFADAEPKHAEPTSRSHNTCVLRPAVAVTGYSAVDFGILNLQTPVRLSRAVNLATLLPACR